MSDSSGGDHHFGLAVQLSMEALKALLLLNGGAATAFIALTDKGAASPDYSISILAFGLGALLTVFAFAAGYFSQLSYANSRFYRDHGVGKIADEQQSHDVCQKLAVALVAAGLLASAVGMITATLATMRAADAAEPACTTKEVATEPVRQNVRQSPVQEKRTGSE